MKKFAVIGDPVQHSMSPAMHNAVFAKLGLDCIFEKVRIQKGRMENEFASLRADYSGLSVTIPHKIAVMPLLDKLDKSAELVGAVNCVDFDGGKSKGYNTDMAGAVDSLKAVVGSLKNKKILVLGAGGAARAIAFGCALEGAEIGIWNRTEKKAAVLMEELKKAGARAWKQKEPADILINATSVGMSPLPEETPIDTDFLESSMTVMDIVYNPLETKLLKEAKKRGCATVDGLEMLVRQGAKALDIWLGIEAPLNVMRKAAERELKT